MIKSKYGPGMVAKDKQELDAVIDNAIEDVGLDYGLLLEAVAADISDGKYSQALKYNVVNRTSWFLKYLHDYISFAN